MESLAMLWNDELDSKYPEVVTVDHPLSLGYRVKVVSCSPYANDDIRISQDALAEQFEGGDPPEGVHAVWEERKLLLIAIAHSAEGNWCKKRVIELIVHEVSHLVDGMFERCAFGHPIETELRAYYNDWIVGKVLTHFDRIGG